MSRESVKLALSQIEKNRQDALIKAEYRSDEIKSKIPKAKELIFLLSQTGAKLSSIVFSHDNNGDIKNKIKNIMQENLNLQNELYDLLEKNNYPRNYLDVQYNCKNCEDTGYVDGHKCSCLKDLIIKYNSIEFSQSIPLKSYAFENFSLHYYDEINSNGKNCKKTMTDIYDFCFRYAASFSKNSPSVMMIGDTGLGKTHLSLAIANVVMKNGFSVLYSSAPDLFRTLQNEYYKRYENQNDTMDTIMQSDLLIIDDLGAEMDNQFTVSTLYNIINMRMNFQKPVIISTNLSLKEIEARYSSRIASRLMTTYRCLKFTGKDIRQQKLKEA